MDDAIHVSYAFPQAMPITDIAPPLAVRKKIELDDVNTLSQKRRCERFTDKTGRTCDENALIDGESFSKFFTHKFLLLISKLFQTSAFH